MRLKDLMLLLVTSMSFSIHASTPNPRASKVAMDSFTTLLGPEPGYAVDEIRSSLNELVETAPGLEIDDEFDQIGTPMPHASRLRPAFQALAATLVDEMREATSAHAALDHVAGRAAAQHALVTIARAYALAGANLGSRHLFFRDGAALGYGAIAVAGLAASGLGLALSQSLYAPEMSYVFAGSGMGMMVALAGLTAVNEMRRDLPGFGPVGISTWVRERKRSGLVQGALACFWSDVAADAAERAADVLPFADGPSMRDGVFARLREVEGERDLWPTCARALTQPEAPVPMPRARRSGS